MEMRRRRKVFVGEECLWENNRQCAAQCGLYCRQKYRRRTIDNVLLKCCSTIGQ